MNYTCITGHVGNDPIIKTFNNSGKLASFSLASTETWKDKQGEKKTRTDWHNIVCNNKIVEVIEKWVKKGTHLLVTGKIRYRNYENKDGVKVYVTEIQLESMEFLGSLKTDNQENKPEIQEQASNNKPAGEYVYTGVVDDLPF